jgi:hypothetical protein
MNEQLLYLRNLMQAELRLTLGSHTIELDNFDLVRDFSEKEVWKFRYYVLI